jgi:hypothetical protein
MMLWFSGEANVSGKRHKMSIRIESLNRNLQSPYLTMWAAVKQSLEKLKTLAVRKNCVLPTCI